MNLEEITQESNTLYNILKNENLVIRSELSDRFAAQTYRHLMQFNNLMRKLEIVKTKLTNYLTWYQQNLPQMPMTPPQYTLEAITLLCYQGLGIYEHCKRFLTLTLDLHQLKAKSGETFGAFPMLGSLITSISKLPNVNKLVLDELFDVDFRNALAHDTWYIQDSDFTYVTTDGRSIVMPYEDLATKIKGVHEAASVMIKRYATDYFPEIVNLYNQANKDFTGGKPPIS